MCHTIYLYHHPLVFASGRIVSRWSLAGYLPSLLFFSAALLPIESAISAALFLLVERSCMRRDWPRRLLAWAGR